MNTHAPARAARGLMMGALLSLAPAAMAGSPTATLPAWEQLSQAQREQLAAPIRERWNAEPGKRQRMLEHAQRWEAMTPEQRGKARHGMNRWQHLTPVQREQMRALYAAMRDLSEAERRELKARWKRMSAEQRRQWVQSNPPKAQGQSAPGD